MSGGGNTAHIKLKVPNVANPTFIAKPGAPHAMRIITMSRSLAMPGNKRGTAPEFTQWANREAMTSDTMSAFAPMYQHFAHEFQGFRSFTPADVIAILETPRTHDLGLINQLESKCPGISDALYSVLLPQYSRGQPGVVNSLLSLDNAGILQRFNAFGLGSQLRAEMLQVLNNSQFFAGISIDIKDKDIKIMKQGLKDPLVEGNVNDDKKTVTLTINANVAPEDRDDAIKHLLMFAACHAQQNNSNVFMPNFGDNIWENIRLMQLAIGEFNLHIPVTPSDESKIKIQISKIADKGEQQKAQAAWDLWHKRAQTFSAKVSGSGTKIIDNNHRENNMSLAKIQKKFRSEVTEDIFPTAAYTPKIGSP